MRICGLPQNMFVSPISKALMGFGGRNISSSSDFFDLVIELSRPFLNEAEMHQELQDPNITMEDFFAPDSTITMMLMDLPLVVGEIQRGVAGGVIPEVAMPLNMNEVLGLKLGQHRQEIYDLFTQKFNTELPAVTVGQTPESFDESEIIADKSAAISDATQLNDTEITSVIDGYFVKAAQPADSEQDQIDFKTKTVLLETEELPIHTIAKGYFSATPYLLQKLKTDFKRVFYDNLVDLELTSHDEEAVGVLGDADSLDDVVDSTRAYFEAKLASVPDIQNSMLDMKNVLETPELAEAYNAMVVGAHFTTFAKEYMTGVDLDEKTLAGSNDSVNTGFTTDGHSLSAESQVSEIDKLHFNNIPRLVAKLGKDIPGKESGEHSKMFLVVDTEQPTLSYANIKNLSEILAEFPGNGSMLEYTETLADTIETGRTPLGSKLSDTNKEILRSIYYRVFAPESYEVIDGYTKIYSSMARAGQGKHFLDPMNKMVNSIFRSIRSAANKEDIQIRNGELIMSQTTISDVGSKVVSGYNNTITSAIDNTTIDFSIARNISFTDVEPKIVIEEVNQDGTVVKTYEDLEEISESIRRDVRNQKDLDARRKPNDTSNAYNKKGVYYREVNKSPYSMAIKLGDFELKLDRTKMSLQDGGRNGRVVTVHNDSVHDLENSLEFNENNILKALSLLGFSNTLKSSFVRQYLSNIESINSESNYGDMSFPQLIANVAFMVGANTEAGQLFLEKRNMLPTLNDASRVDEVSTKSLTNLPYPVFDYVGEFAFPMTQYIEKAQGVSRVGMRTNLNNDRVATQSPRSRMEDTQKMAYEFKSTANSFYANNAMVNGVDGEGADFSITQWYIKDGIVVNDIKKSVSAMTMREQMKMLVEDAFLQTAHRFKFKQTLIQPGVYADRSEIKLALVEMASKGKIERASDTLLPRLSSSELDRQALSDRFGTSITSEMNAVNTSLRTAWYAAAKELKIKGLTKTAIDKTKTVGELKALIDSLKIPMKKITGSNYLGAEMHYTKNWDTGNVTIKGSMAQLYDISQNKRALDNFIEFERLKFRETVKKSGYLENKDVSGKTYKIMSEVFPEMLGDQVKHAVLDSYFYNANFIGNNILNLMMGSEFLYKGEEKTGKDMLEDADFRRKIETSKDIQDAITKLEHDLIGTEDEYRLPKAVSDLIEHRADMIALSDSLGAMTLTKSKRNAAVGSTYQHVRTVGKNEKGAYLGKISNVAVVKDPAWLRKVMGSFTDEEIDTYDAAMIAHPLYFIKLENSLGNEYSGYATKGGAAKDITFEVDPITGVVRFQKKATFNLFSNEILANGSEELNEMFRNMNEQILFDLIEGQTITVPKVSLVDGEYVVSETEEVQLAPKNMQELWEHFGAYDNDLAWEHVATVLGDHPEIRDNYIQKVGFVSGEKVGNRGINTDDTITGKKKLTYNAMRNDFHGVILNSYHDPDTTASYIGGHSNMVSVMTQAINASGFEGDTFELTESINDSLLQLSRVNVALIKNQVFEDAYKNVYKDYTIIKKDLQHETPEVFAKALFDRGYIDSAITLDTFEALLNAPNLSDSQKATLNIIFERTNEAYKATDKFVRAITLEALKKREAFGVNVDLLNDEKSNLGIKQIINTVHSNLMAHVTKKTVRVKFPGGQYVVAPSYDLIKLYTLPNGNRVDKKTYLSAMKARGESKIITFEEFTRLDDTHSIEVDGSVMSVWQFKKAYRDSGNEGSFGEFFTNEYTGKVTAVHLPIVEEGDNSQFLKWMEFKNAEGINSFDTEEFQELFSYNVITNRSFDILKLNHAEEMKAVDPDGKALTFAQYDKLPKDKKAKYEKGYKKLFKAYLQTDAGILKYKQLRKALDTKMANTTEGWVQSDAEFAMPQLHAAAYGLHQGDQVAVILGHHLDQPEGMSDEDFETVLLNYRKDWFKQNMIKNEKSIPSLSLKKPKGEKGHYNLVGSMADRVAIKSELRKRMNFLDPGDPIYAQLNKLVNQTDVTLDDINRAKLAVYDTIAIKQAIDFPKTLEIITGRIPGQGKQSYTAGVIKIFINSTQNSSYGPIQHNIVTGADHDIDKTNVMAYSVDMNGYIYKADKYLGADGKISAAKLEAILSQGAKIIEERFAGKLPNNEIKGKIDNFLKIERAYFTEATKNFVLEKLMASVRDPKNAIEAGTPMAMNKLKAFKALIEQISKESGLDVDESYFGNAPSPYNPATIPMYEIENAVGKAAVGVFATALKTYSAVYTTWMQDTLDNKLEFRDEFREFENGDPENTAAAKLHYKELLDIHNVEMDEDTRKTFVDEIEFGTMILPQTVMNENLGIEETRQVKAVRNSISLHYRYQDGVDVDNKPIYKYKLVRKQTVANTNKYINKEVLELAESMPDQEYAQQVIALYNQKIADELPEDQAWMDLSELLSAATDNAKELILNKIGATSTTNGIISTMVILGYDLSDALKFLKQPKIVDVLQQVQDATDTELTQSGHVVTLENLLKKEGSYTLSTRAPGLAQKLGANTNDELEGVFDPLMELFKFTKAAKEIKLISGTLSINQGLPSSPYDMYKYIAKMQNGINKMYIDSGLDLVKNPGDKFNLFDFISSPEYRDKHIKQFDNIKVAFNVPLIINQNKHFFGYLEGLMFGNESFKKVTSMFQSLEHVTGVLTKAEIMDLDTTLSKDQFDEITEMVYGLGIENFFKDDINSFKLGDKSYDLWKKADRDTFLNNVVKIVKGIKIKQRSNEWGSYENNIFIDELEPVSHENKMTGESYVLLRTRDLNAMDDTQESIMNLELIKLKRQYPELHKALFYYTLITEKGSRSAKSFAQIIDSETFEDYSRHVQKVAEDPGAIKRVLSLPVDGLLLACPSFIPIVSTAKYDQDEKDELKKAEYIKAAASKQEGEELFMDYLETKRENSSEIGGMSRVSFDAPNKFNAFNMARALKDISRPKGSLKKTRLFRSSETGRIYHVGEKNVIREITPEYNKHIIPYTSTIEKGELSISYGGYQFGTPVNIGDTTKGVLLGWDAKSRYYNVMPLDGGPNDVMPMSIDLLRSYNPLLSFKNIYVGRKTRSEMMKQRKGDTSRKGFHLSKLLNFSLKESPTELTPNNKAELAYMVKHSIPMLMSPYYKTINSLVGDYLSDTYPNLYTISDDNLYFEPVKLKGGGLDLREATTELQSIRVQKGLEGTRGVVVDNKIGERLKIKPNQISKWNKELTDKEVQRIQDVLQERNIGLDDIAYDDLTVLYNTIEDKVTTETAAELMYKAFNIVAFKRDSHTIDIINNSKIEALSKLKQDNVARDFDPVYIQKKARAFLVGNQYALDKFLKKFYNLETMTNPQKDLVIKEYGRALQKLFSYQEEHEEIARRNWNTTKGISSDGIYLSYLNRFYLDRRIAGENLERRGFAGGYKGVSSGNQIEGYEIMEEDIKVQKYGPLKGKAAYTINQDGISAIGKNLGATYGSDVEVLENLNTIPEIVAQVNTIVVMGKFYTAGDVDAHGKHVARRGLMGEAGKTLALAEEASTNLPLDRRPDIFVFDANIDKWTIYNAEKNIYYKVTRPPVLRGDYMLFGDATEDLTRNSRQAIVNVHNRSTDHSAKSYFVDIKMAAINNEMGAIRRTLSAEIDTEDSIERLDWLDAYIKYYKAIASGNFFDSTQIVTVDQAKTKVKAAEQLSVYIKRHGDVRSTFATGSTPELELGDVKIVYGNEIDDIEGLNGDTYTLIVEQAAGSPKSLVSDYIKRNIVKMYKTINAIARKTPEAKVYLPTLAGDVVAGYTSKRFAEMFKSASKSIPRKLVMEEAFSTEVTGKVVSADGSIVNLEGAVFDNSDVLSAEIASVEPIKSNVEIKEDNDKHDEEDLYGIEFSEGEDFDPNTLGLELQLGPITTGYRIKSKKAGKPLMTKLINRLTEISPGIEVQPMTSQEIRMEYGNKAAKANGFVSAGKVVINTDIATLDTPLHEYAGHIYVKYIKSTNPELYNKIINLSLESSLKQEIYENYPWLKTDEDLGEEIFATMLGLESQGMIEKADRDNWRRVSDIASNSTEKHQSFWEWVRGWFNTMFGITDNAGDAFYKLNMNDSLKSIMNKITEDVLYDKSAMLQDMMAKEDLTSMLSTSMQYGDIKNSLVKQGYIIQVCD